MEHIIEHKEALNFIFAGNSTFTVRNSESGNRFTFKCKNKKNTDLFFISVLTGSNNYTYIGIVINKIYKHGKKSVVSNKAKSVLVFDYILRKLKNNTLDNVVEIWHEGKCGKCGRKLTDPSSISSGYGPSCIKNMVTY